MSNDREHTPPRKRRWSPWVTLPLTALALTVAPSLAEAAPGDSFWDGCPADITIPVQAGGNFYQSNSSTSSYHSPWGCPMWVVDFWGPNTGVHAGGSWMSPSLNTSSACSGAWMKYAVARNDYSTHYTVVGDGILSGQWINGACWLVPSSGSSSTHFFGNAGVKYRLLSMSTFHGSSTTTAGWIATD